MQHDNNINHSNWIMYFGMFLASYWMMSILITNNNNITNNLNKLYQAIFMVLIMFVLANYNNYIYIMIGMIITLIIVYIIRYQVFINDDQFLLSMIEHHQMAVDMSDRILEKSNNQQVKLLATNIINSQLGEIEYMKKLLNNNTLKTDI